MSLENKRDYFNIVFEVGMWWRIVYGILKFCFGLFLLNYIHHSFGDLFNHFFILEIKDDSKDLFIKITNLFLDRHHFVVTYFISFYFIFWGALDAFLSINILRLKIWAYPVSLFLISIFTTYEFFRFLHHKSLLLLSVILFDLFILWVINKEYKKLKSKKQNMVLKEIVQN